MSELYKRNVTDTKFENGEIEVLGPYRGEYDDDFPMPDHATTTSYTRGGEDLYTFESHMCIDMDDGGGREEAWNFFEGHLRQSKPLKIRNWTMLREGGDASSSFLDRRGHLLSSYEALIRSMPAGALDAAVTVQTKPLLDASNYRCKACSGSNESVELTDVEKIRHNRHLVDQKLTTAPVFQGDERNIFYGQEDQVTAEMKLGDVLGDADLERKICVAQENIFSNRSEGDIGNGDGNERERGTDENHAKMSVSNDGRCIPSCPGSHNPAPLAVLLPWIRVPSFLLPTDGGINIREVNLWTCPKECRTNTHYDGHHNILMVLSGTKTVELSPPGTFRGSPVHNDHANHPYLLRCVHVGGHLANDWFDYDTGTFSDEAEYNNIVVSITAGEAVFIPEGWWHRVESSDRCVAVNIWFDHENSSVSAISHSDNPHMLPYQAREMVRRYIDANVEELNEKRARLAFVQLLGQHGFEMRGWSADWMRDPGLAVRRFLESVAYGRLRPKERSNEEIHSGLQIIEEYAHHLLCVVDESPNAKSGAVPSLQQLALYPGARSLSLMISFFLTLLDPKNNRDRIAMISLFDRFPAVHTYEKREVFTAIVKGITQEACYNLSIAWEKHTPTEQAQASYSSVFGRCVKDEGRRHFMTQIDAFRNESARKLICGDLMLLNPREGE